MSRLEQGDAAMSGAVLESALFALKDGVTREAFMATVESMSQWAAEQQGFVSRELFEVGDGRWIDIVRWATMADAMHAGEVFMESEACRISFALMDESSVQVTHANPVIEVVHPAESNGSSGSNG
jgi:hypothetical protein